MYLVRRSNSSASRSFVSSSSRLPVVLSLRTWSTSIVSLASCRFFEGPVAPGSAISPRCTRAELPRLTTREMNDTLGSVDAASDMWAPGRLDGEVDLSLGIPAADRQQGTRVVAALGFADRALHVGRARDL